MDIQKIMSAAADNLEAVLADFDRQTEEKISASREAGQLLGDFIMDTKSFRRGDCRANLRADLAG